MRRQLRDLPAVALKGWMIECVGDHCLFDIIRFPLLLLLVCYRKNVNQEENYDL